MRVKLHIYLPFTYSSTEPVSEALRESSTRYVNCPLCREH